MLLTHPAFLFGLLLVAVPVLLHLLMRAKPKKLMFPALRLIQNRKRSNSRRLRLRHLALLLLRMGVIALLAIGLARPAVPAADYSLNGSDWLRIALVLGGCASAYFAFLTMWKRRSVPQHEYASRRSMLRAVVAALGILGFCLVVAWPYQQRIAAAINQPTVASDEFLPVAAVMLFDTSLSMGYRQENKTRLEIAQEIAVRQIGQMPRMSRVAIAETAGDGQIRFSSDLGGVSKRISTLVPQVVNRSLDDRILTALEAHSADKEQAQGSEAESADSATGENLQREIYLFTDLASSAWRQEQLPRLKEMLDQLPQVNLYIIDVGVMNPTNVALTELVLSDQILSAGSSLDLRAAVSSVGIESGERVVELWVMNENQNLVKLDQTTVKIEAGSAASANFSRQVPAGPVVQGELRLVSSDPLPFDDVRSFTVLVHPPTEVLIVSENKGDAVYLMNVLAPPELVAVGESRHHCKWINTAQLRTADLSKFSVVCLIDVTDPQEAGWKSLEKFAENGGGIAIYLGENVKHAAYLSPAALAVFPGQLKGKIDFDEPTFMDLQNPSHAILKKFGEWGGGLATVEINRCWSVDPGLVAGAIASYTDRNHLPALVERALGKGRVMACTTAIDRRDWNDLPLDWGFAPLSYETIRYLARSSQSQFNYAAGEDVMLPLMTSKPISAYRLRKPGLQQIKEEIPDGMSTLLIKGADQLGNYRVSGADPDPKFECGFSVNAPAEESRLDRLPKEDLNQHLGLDRYSVARDLESLQRNVKTGRLGREAFPLLALLLLAVFVGENFVANRFYEQGDPADEQSSRQ